MIFTLVLAAGHSRRINSSTPKILHTLGGKKVIDYVLNTAEEVSGKNVLVVVSHHTENHIKNHNTILQTTPLGTGYATLLGLLKIKSEHVLVLFGDTPLFKSQTLINMYNAHIENKNVITLATTRAKCDGYGVVNINDNNQIESIIETRNHPVNINDPVHNGGAMCLSRLKCIELLKKIENKKDVLLTEIIEIAFKLNLKTETFHVDFEETIGINTKKDLNLVENILQKKWKEKIINNNTVIDKNSIYISHNVELTDTVVHPFVTFGPNVKAYECEILPNTRISNSKINSMSIVGPFAHIRDSIIEKNVHIGNFVEINRSKIESNTKIKHMSYIGDCTIKEKCNVGAGVIVCNYDGKNKHKTIIGENSFIGSNVSIVAPRKIGKNVRIGVGSVINHDINDDTIAVAISKQINKCVD